MVMIAPTTCKRKNDSPNFGTHNESLLTRPMTAPPPGVLILFWDYVGDNLVPHQI